MKNDIKMFDPSNFFLILIPTLSSSLIMRKVSLFSWCTPNHLHSHCSPILTRPFFLYFSLVTSLKTVKWNTYQLLLIIQTLKHFEQIKAVVRGYVTQWILLYGLSETYLGSWKRSMMKEFCKNRSNVTLLVPIPDE